MNEEQTDFENRCRALEIEIGTIGTKETSAKVWAAVLSETLKAICKVQNEPKKALQEIIDNLIMYFDVK